MSDVAVWRLMAHHEDPETAASWALREGRIAIGWGSSGDLRQLGSADTITRAILRSWPDSHNAGPGGAQLLEFRDVMRRGDLVIVSTGKQRVLVGEVTGDYEFSGADDVPVYGGDYRHQRRIDVLPYPPDLLWRMAGGGLAAGYDVRWTLVRCKGAVRPAAVAAAARLQ